MRMQGGKHGCGMRGGHEVEAKQWELYNAGIKDTRMRNAGERSEGTRSQLDLQHQLHPGTGLGEHFVLVPGPRTPTTPTSQNCMVITPKANQGLGPPAGARTPP